jgi:Tfp pilus assembly protein PilN
MKLLRPIHRDLPSFNLVPWRERQRRTRWRRATQLFAALGAVLSLGMFVLLTQQLAAQSDLNALLAEVNQQQKPNVAAYATTLQRAQALYQNQYPLDQLRQQLAELSSAMPTDAVLTEVSMDHNALVLHGMAQHIQAITALQNLLQNNTKTRVVLEQVEAIPTSTAHRFRIHIPLDQDANSGEGAS